MITNHVSRVAVLRAEAADFPSWNFQDMVGDAVMKTRFQALEDICALLDK